MWVPLAGAIVVLVNAYCTLREPPDMGFAHTLRSRRDLTDPELPKHLDGFVGYVMDRGGGEMTARLYHLYRHIQRVRHQMAFEVDDAALDAMSTWASAANAVLFLPDGTVRDPSGRVIVGPDGEGNEGAHVPYPEDAVARKQRSDEALRARGYAVPASLPPVVGEGEVDLRTADEVARRALALLLVALRAESLSSGEPIDVASLKERLGHGYDALSPLERRFVAMERPEPQQVVNHGWRYEALWVLEWALGLVPELPPPADICDVPATASALLEPGEEAIVAGSALRPVADVLDALDEHFRMHWVAREAGRDGGAPAPNLHPGVLQERHYALNWLCRFEGSDWDDVDTPT